MKTALCVKRADLHKICESLPARYSSDRPTGFSEEIDTTAFNQLHCELKERAECEDDPEWLQLIPYITLISPDYKYFTYIRGKGGQESRLHQKYSLGLGGHVETIPNPLNSTLFDVVLDGALRELEEEVGLILTSEQIDTLELEYHSKIKIIYDDTDFVGSVHLGIFIPIVIDTEQLSQHEVDVVLNGNWQSPHWISTACMLDLIQLEQWSKWAFLELIKLKMPYFD